MAEEKIEAITVALQIEERMMLSMLLTQSEGSALMLGIVRQFREKMSPNEDEQESLGIFTTEDGRTGWNSEADTPVEFKIGPSLRTLIVKMLKRADEAQGLTLAQLTLFEKFVGEIEEVALSEEDESHA